MIHKISDVLDSSDSASSGFGLAAVSRATAAYNGAGVDTTKYEGGLAFLISAGTVPASTTVDAKIQDSADNSTFADLASPIAITQLNAAAGYAKLDVRTRQVRQYVRVVLTIGGTGPAVVGVIFVGQKRAL